MLNNNFLTGKLVRLAALDPDVDGPLWSKWRRNSEYDRMADTDPATMHSARASREWIEKHLDDLLSYEFEIRTLDGDQVIGSVGLGGDILLHADAFVGIGVGETQFWGKGYGSEAMQLILRYAFMELNLQRVSLDVFDYNQRAIRSYEKVGFKVEGRQRGMILREGKRWDMIYMGLLREEWLEQGLLAEPA